MLAQRWKRWISIRPTSKQGKYNYLRVAPPGEWVIEQWHLVNIIKASFALGNLAAYYRPRNKSVTWQLANLWTWIMSRLTGLLWYLGSDMTTGKLILIYNEWMYPMSICETQRLRTKVDRCCLLDCSAPSVIVMLLWKQTSSSRCNGNWWRAHIMSYKRASCIRYRRSLNS